MKYTISEKLRPPPHCFYGDSYERSKSPWHASMFPPDLAHAAPEQDEHKGGWSLLDSWKNEIGFVADGTEIEIDVRQFKSLPKDLQDEIMRQGAYVMLETQEQAKEQP